MKRFIFSLAIVLALPALALAQAKPATPAAASGATSQSLILAFVPEGLDLTVTTPAGKVLTYGQSIEEGDVIPLGSTIATGATTTAELKLKPNGTIIKLAKSTKFIVQKLAGGQIDTNAFAVIGGKIRTIAAKGSKYDFSSQTAVCGVRGTDFTFSVDEGNKALLMVKKGKIEFQKVDTSGQPLGKVDVGAGQAADVFAAAFEAFQFSEAQFAQEFGDMVFQKLNETEVNQDAEAVAAVPAATTPAAGTTEVKPVTAAEAASTLAAGASKLTKSDVESGLVKWLKDIMGFELGSVTIDDKTWAKAIIQPNFNLGKVKFGLYLPIIYNNDLFNPDDWYHPNGNDEWSFGISQFNAGNYVDGALDLFSDVALKVKYFEFGRQLRDPFFIKVGNLDDLTLGHGLIMRNYANDEEFPAVRRVGMNIGVDAGGFGFEALASDLADLANGIYGGRLYIRPIKGSKLAFGISGVADINPLGGNNVDILASTYGDPILFGLGVDLDLPIITSDILSIRLFADAAAETEYLQSTASNGAEAGFKYQLIYDEVNQQFNNWGAAGGFMGNVLFIDWRLEYRYYTGIFTPALFDSTYDKTRAATAIKYNGYLANPSSLSSQPSVMGVYGEGGFSLIKDKLSLTLGYMWPWAPGKTVEWQLANAQDEFHGKLVIQKGLIPIFDVNGSIYYDRKGLVQAISAGDFKLLDGDTSFGGEVVVPVPKTPGLSIAALFSAIAGSYTTTGEPELVPSVTLETRLSF